MQPSRTSRRVLLAVAALTTMFLLASCAATTPKRGEVARGAAVVLPDSVLAIVGEGRTITRSDFDEAWQRVEPPARPERLTPEAARQFLDLLIGKEALGEAALGERWTWTAEESARVIALRDRLMMRAALDSALRVASAARAAAGEDSLSLAELGTLARDQMIARMNVRYDEALIERLARRWAEIPKPPSDSGMFAALRALGRDPKIDEVDLAKVAARTATLEFRTIDLLNHWRRMNPISRPRIGLPSQVKDLIANGLYEQRLREDALARGLDRLPEVELAVRHETEFIAVSHLVSREVYEKIPVDSTSLARYYLEHEDAWDLPPRVRLLRMVFKERSEATEMALKLRNAALVDSLVGQAQALGLTYEAEYSAETDSALFVRSMKAGTGAVFGPDSTSRGWAASRVQAILPGRARPFSEVRELVRNALNGESGERLMQELLERVRKNTRVRVNEPAVRRAGGA